MADPLEHLSDSDLQALAKNDLNSMSDEGLKIVAASGDSGPARAAETPKEEPLGHKIIRNVLPVVGQVGGALAAGALATPETLGVGTLPAAMAGSAAGNIAGNEGAAWLNHKIYGDEAPTYDKLDDVKRLAVNGAVGAGAELGGQLIGKGVSAAADSAIIKPYLDSAGNLIVNGFNKLGQFVGKQAENLAVKATGATGVQASKFAPGTGRTLLDEGIVKFGRSQEGIANAAQEALDAQGEKIGAIIKDLSDKGATGNREELVQALQSKIDELHGNAGEADTVRKLQAIQQDIAAGPERPSLELMEQTKRSFQNKVNYQDPDAQAAKAAAADVFRESSERVATAANPETGEAFQGAKKLYGQLNPVAEASAKRAATVNQSPMGGFLDVTSAAAGGVAGGPALAVAAPIARRMIAPRMASSMAATANSVSKVLSNTPQFFGKWAPALTSAATRGELSLNASVYVLQQQDPEFRQKMDELNNSPGLSQSEDKTGKVAN